MNFIPRIAIAIICIMTTILPLFAEAVFMKDGSILQGKITAETVDSITINTEDKRILRIKRGGHSAHSVYQTQNGKGVHSETRREGAYCTHRR